MSLDRVSKEYLDALELELCDLDLDFVSRMQRAHLARFSFNNIGVLLDEEISLDIEALCEKIVRRNRGGYCFEHNKLFFHALDQLGYDVQFFLGRVTPELHSDGPRTHRITILKYEGKEYLIDVGFGPGVVRGLVPFSIDETFAFGETDARIVVNEFSEYVLQSRKRGNVFSSLYTFDLARYTDGDCDAANLYSYLHPKAAFRNKLMVSLILSGETRSIINANYRLSKQGGDAVDTVLDSSEEMRAILDRDYELSLSAEEAVRVWSKVQSF